MCNAIVGRNSLIKTKNVNKRFLLLYSKKVKKCQTLCQYSLTSTAKVVLGG